MTLGESSARRGKSRKRCSLGGSMGEPHETGDSRLKFERFRSTCSLWAVSKFTKIVALTVLALWGLAAMHCKLEALPGFDFLKSCCFVDSAPSSPEDCESDGCGAVEDGSYRSEEQTASAPQPFLIFALLSLVIEAPIPEFQACSSVSSRPPPDLPCGWQFSFRTALPPRAPSLVA
jgi:hypothetical protein